MDNQEFENIKKESSKYKFWKDKKMIGTILLIIIVSLQIFAFLKVPFLSTINGYTIGMFFGFHNPLFYIFVGYISLIMIFGNKIKLPKWIKLSKFTYWLVAISIIFISTSLGYYQSRNGFIEIGTKTWGSFNTWYHSFTNNETANALIPENTNGGLIGVFLYSFVSMVSSGVGAMVVSIGLLIISLSIIFTGSSIGLYKYIVNKRKKDLKNKEIKNNKNDDIDQFKVPEDNNNKVYKEEKSNPEKLVEEKNIDALPFDDPF